MFCPNCGANLPDGTKFCSNCGAAVSNPSPAPSQQQNTSPYAPNYQPAQPAQPTYQQPAQPTYQQPAQPTYQQPAQEIYQQPAQPAYQQPAQETYQSPVQPAYQQPAYQQPAQSEYAEQQTDFYQAPKKPLNKKLIAIIAGSAAAVVAIVVVLILVLGGGSNSNYEDVVMDYLNAYVELDIDEMDKCSVCNFNKLFPDYDKDDLEEIVEYYMPDDITFKVLDSEELDEEDVEELNDLLDEYRDDIGKKYFKSGKIEEAVEVKVQAKRGGTKNTETMILVKIDGNWYFADEDGLGSVYEILYEIS